MQYQTISLFSIGKYIILVLLVLYIYNCIIHHNIYNLTNY